jgi:dTMP kinase
MSAAPRPSTRHGKLLAVAGIDGAGKSTLAAALCARLNDAGHDTILVGKHTVDVPSNEELSHYLDAANALVYRRPPSVGRACGDRYWLFALAAWYALQDQLVVRPALHAGTHVILDNTHHKILARYAVNPRVSSDLAHQVFADLPTPDLVLHLHVSALEALHRKQEFTPLEAGHNGPSREDFICYQNKVADELSRQQSNDTWRSIDVTDKDPAAVLHDALAALRDHGILAVAHNAHSHSAP